MTWIFNIRDATGRIIHLSCERWNHIQKHPEMSGQLEQIQETLQHPDCIIPFDIDPFVHFYYKYYKERREYLFVSVKYLNGHGFMITGFYTDKIKR